MAKIWCFFLFFVDLFFAVTLYFHVFQKADVPVSWPLLSSHWKCCHLSNIWTENYTAQKNKSNYCNFTRPAYNCKKTTKHHTFYFQIVRVNRSVWYAVHIKSERASLNTTKVTQQQCSLLWKVAHQWSDISVWTPGGRAAMGNKS